VVPPLGDAAGLCKGQAGAKELRGFARSAQPQQRWKRVAEGKVSSGSAFLCTQSQGEAETCAGGGRNPLQPWFVLFSCIIHPRGLVQSHLALLPPSNKLEVLLSLLEGPATPALQPRGGKPATDCVGPGEKAGSTRSPQCCPGAGGEGKAEKKHPVNSHSITWQPAQHPESWRTESGRRCQAE